MNARALSVSVLIAVGGLAAEIGPTPSHAQSLLGDVGLSGGAGVGYEFYSFASSDAANIKSLSLLSVPVRAQLPLVGRSTLEVRGAWAQARLERPNGTDSSISGLTDTEIGLGVSFGPPSFVTTLTGVALLPTGYSTHSAAEADIAGVIAADLLPFRISHWGSGGGAGARIASVRAFDWGNFGIGGGYLVGREFEPLEGDQLGTSFKYRPGDQLQLRAGVDRNVGTSSKLTLSLGFQHHREDEVDSANLFRSGNRYHAMSSYAFAAGTGGSAIVYVGASHREEGSALLDFSRDIPAQTLALVGGGLRWPFAGGVLLPSVDARIFRTDDGVGQGFLTALGTSLELPMGGATIVPSARARFGNVLVRRGSESGIMGADLGLAIRFGSR